MTENIVYFKMKHESQTYKIPIQGVNIQLKDLRQKIKEFLKMPQPVKGQSNYEDLVIYAESEQIGGLEKALGLADKVRNKQTVIVVRQPQGQSLCDSCLCAKSNSQTPCCQRRICQQCEEQFIKFAKCFFNELQQCPFKYVNYQVQTIRQQTEISNSELEVQIKSAVFFIVKSNTEQNVILAKNHDVWATTRRNFGTLMDQFNNKKVILIFIANRVEKFLGCAKMKNISVPRDPKWQWHGTSTIQLADNFSIEWLRKGSVDFTKLQDTINPKTGDLVIRSKDCQEVPADIGQRICLLFEQIKQNDEEQEPQPQPQQEPTPKQDDNEWDLGQIISPVKSPVREPEQKSRSPSPQKPPQQPPQINMQQYALFSQIIAPLYQQQKMEQDWNKMNVGKIPGLTGKVQYPHPFLQKYNQKQNKLAEALLIQMSQRQEDEKKEKERVSASHSKKHKKKKNRDRSSSEEKRRSRKKSKDRKDKRSKHKKRSRSRSHSRDHKKKKH